MPLPRWIEPQLHKLATKAPSGPQWAHEIKLDGYRMTAGRQGQAPDPIGPGLDSELSCNRNASSILARAFMAMSAQTP
jgi:hypothetical protein